MGDSGPGLLKVSRMPDGRPEIFRSIQGEGISAGTPTTFLRLATCNLACSWCDTRYTWDWAKYDYEEQVLMTSTADAVHEIRTLGEDHLVITGGEPLLQQSALEPLVKELAESGCYIEFETNGTVVPSRALARAVSQWNVSPKLSNSGNNPLKREVEEALSAFMGLDTANFKFVVVDQPDLDEINELTSRYAIPANRVVLQPEGISPDELTERAKWLADECRDRGYRMGQRLHIYLWGAKRAT